MRRPHKADRVLSCLVISTTFLLGLAIPGVSATVPEGRDPREVLASARTAATAGMVGEVVYRFWAQRAYPSSARARQALEKALRDWGRLTLVDNPDTADLVVIIVEGNRNTAIAQGQIVHQLFVFRGGSAPGTEPVLLWKSEPKPRWFANPIPKLVKEFAQHLGECEKAVASGQTATPLAISPALATTPPATAPVPTPEDRRPTEATLLDTADPGEVMLSAKTVAVIAAGPNRKRGVQGFFAGMVTRIPQKPSSFCISGNGMSRDSQGTTERAGEKVGRWPPATATLVSSGVRATQCGPRRKTVQIHVSRSWRVLWLFLPLALLAQSSQPKKTDHDLANRHLLLADWRAPRLQKKINHTAAASYRVTSAWSMGELVVLMEKVADSLPAYEYQVVRDHRIYMMETKLREAGAAGFRPAAADGPMPPTHTITPTSTITGLSPLHAVPSSRRAELRGWRQPFGEELGRVIR